MKKSNEEILLGYYEGLAKKKNWEELLSEDFKFIGGDMSKQEPLVGKSAYVEVIGRFSRLFTNVRIKDMIHEGDRSFVIANYDYIFPGGVNVNGDVAEYWRIKEDKLDQLTIFFDTKGFEALLKR